MPAWIRPSWARRDRHAQRERYRPRFRSVAADRVTRPITTSCNAPRARASPVRSTCRIRARASAPWSRGLRAASIISASGPVIRTTTTMQTPARHTRTATARRWWCSPRRRSHATRRLSRNRRRSPSHGVRPARWAAMSSSRPPMPIRRSGRRCTRGRASARRSATWQGRAFTTTACVPVPTAIARRIRRPSGWR